jgi:hypothetical protein
VIELFPPALVVLLLGIFHFVLPSSFVKRNPNYKCCYPTKEPGIVATHKDFKSAHHVPTIKKRMNNQLIINDHLLSPSPALSVIPARTTSAPPRYNPYERKGPSMGRSSSADETYSVDAEERQQRVSQDLERLTRQPLPHPSSKYFSFSSRWFESKYSIDEIINDRTSQDIVEEEEEEEEEAIMALDMTEMAVKKEKEERDAIAALVGMNGLTVEKREKEVKKGYWSIVV